MIRSFKCSDTEKLFHGGRILKWLNIEDSARRKLQLLHSATNLKDLTAVRGARLELLKWDRAGKYSLRINTQYRICFRWENSSPTDVEINKRYE
jgi:proteic killer suppression protein